MKNLPEKKGRIQAPTNGAQNPVALSAAAIGCKHCLRFVHKLQGVCSLTLADLLV